MSNDTEVALAKAAMELRAANPEGWAAFVGTLRLRYLERAQSCAFAPSTELQVAQGRAQEAYALVTSLDKAPDLAAIMQQKERNNGNRTR